VRSAAIHECKLIDSTQKGIGVFQEYYETHQLKSYSSSTISWITSLEAFFMMFMVRCLYLRSLNTVELSEMNYI
jgi:hypothetical protein